MKQFYSPARAERGAVLVVGLIVLMLITVMVAAAFKFSTYNLKSVGNMQAHNEAIAAANKAIELVINSRRFDIAQVAEPTQSIDVDNDTVADYLVNIAAPVCVKATRNSSTGENKSEMKANLDGTFSDPNSGATIVLYNVIFDIDAVSTSVASGARVRIHQGISRSLSQSQCDAACPPAAGGVCS